MVTSKDKKVLGVITARSGSKGIKDKNIKILDGKPLIYYTIKVAQKSKLISDFIVSTDSDKYIKIARNYGANTPFIRPKELATDECPHAPVLQHALNFMEKSKNCKYDYIVNLQPTSPFRTVEDLDTTIKKTIDFNAESGVSVVKVENSIHPIKYKKIENGFILPYSIEEPSEGVRRQDLPEAYKRDGAVYVTRRDILLNESKIFGEKTIAHIVDSERSIDIDTLKDWYLAEYMIRDLKNRGYEF